MPIQPLPVSTGASTHLSINPQPVTPSVVSLPNPADTFETTSSASTAAPANPLAAPSSSGINLRSFISALTAGQTSMSPEAMIAEVVKTTLKDKTASDVTAMMKAHFIQMKLMDENGVWANEKLASIGDQLLPQNLDGSDLAGLTDLMAENAAENPYLHNFLKQASGADLAKLYRMVGKEGNRILPDVMAYAMVQERLNVAMREDWKVLEACQAVWSKELTTADMREHFDLFEMVKKVSVDYPVELILEAHRSGEVPENFWRVILPVNILEAMAMDAKLGNYDNAKVAWTLATNPPGGSENPATGAGPARFAEDGQAIEVHMPLTQEWVDLYHTWNMAFVSHYEHFPYVMAKLLIPNVADYQDAPEEYMYNRAMALYTHINFALLGRINDGVSKDSMSWSSEAMTESWGRVNNESRHDYNAKLDRLDPSLLSQIRTAMSSFFG